MFTGQDGEVKLLVLDPGHFHASLVQKYPIPQINKNVHVYAPEGKELDAYLNAVEGFNRRQVNPTDWNQIVYTGDDYQEKMVSEHKGNVVILAGNNQKKIDYIVQSLNAGYNILADKPLIIEPENFPLLENAYQIAGEKGVLLSDMMTERHEITNIIQGILIRDEGVFGSFIEGSPEKPAIESESVHHFLKTVSGSPLIRPEWYYNIEQQGEGIADVTTHLIDLINHNCFPEQIIDYRTDINIYDAGRSATRLTLEDYKESTGLEQFPDFLQKYIDSDILNVYANGYICYTVKNIPIKINVKWDLRTPEGGGDTHFLIARGTKSDIMILQGKEQNYKPELYVKKHEDVSDELFDESLNTVIVKLQNHYPGVEIGNADSDKGLKHIIIPDKLKKGHESHFSQVIETYIDCLEQGEIPDWEISNTLAKYYITTRAVEIARSK